MIDLEAIRYYGSIGIGVLARNVGGNFPIPDRLFLSDIILIRSKVVRIGVASIHTRLKSVSHVVRLTHRNLASTERNLSKGGVDDTTQRILHGSRCLSVGP